jgi:hypothetical protein
MSAKLTHLRWVVGARAKNQRRLYDLLRYGRTHCDAIECDDDRQTVFTLLVGAGFSLWRAAPLSEVERSNAKIAEAANQLLDRLVRDNSIGYPQDQDTREWMGGYYVNNAKWRLQDVCLTLSRSPRLRLDAITLRRAIDGVHVDTLPLKESWSELDKAFGKLATLLQAWPPNKRLRPAARTLRSRRG